MNLYYLGPKGTYSEMAANCISSKIQNLSLVPISTIAKVVDLVNNEKKSLGIIPIENSIDGIVRPALDNIYSHNVSIQAELEIKINHCLVSNATSFGDIKKILSHPQAIAQCQKFILDNFDENIELINTHSTAQAGYEILNSSCDVAAIVSQKFANDLGLKILSYDISDIKDNKTRFVLISQSDFEISSKTRTSFVFNTKNEPGALLKILAIINKHNLNLIYLESRPSRKVFGEYNFFADVDKGEDEIKDALFEIQKECNFYKLLGSYGRIDNF